MKAFRALAARPAFTIAAVLILALGLGVSGAIFSVTRTVLLRPLAYRDADRLVVVYETSPSRGVVYAPSAPINYISWRERTDAFEDTAAFRRVSFNVSTGGSTASG